MVASRPSALYVARPLDWTAQRYLGDFEGTPNNQDTHSVGGCDWLDSETAVALIDNWSNNGAIFSTSYLALVDTSAGSVTRITPDEGNCCQAGLLVSADEELAYWTYVRSTLLITEQPGQPVAVNVASGQEYSLLQKGDWLVGIVTP